MRTALRRSWTATGYLVAGLRTALPALLALPAALLTAVLLVLAVGMPWLPEAVRPLRGLANMERRRAGRALGEDIPEPYVPLQGTPFQRAKQLLRAPATWRDLVWAVVHGISGLYAGLIMALLWPGTLYSLSLPLWWWAVPRGEVSAFVALWNWPQALTLPFAQAGVEILLLWWGAPRLARAQTRFARWLLRPTGRDRLAERVEELTATRAEALEAHGAELRRIERDLHDGTQAHLVSVAMRLGLAVRDYGGEQSLKLIEEARDGVEETLTQLRTVIRGIYPPILSDRGLAGAVRALAAGQQIPVTVTVPEDMPRTPAAVEAAAYFVVAEALTNVAKHSGARSATATVQQAGQVLRIAVSDDGKGGADASAGSGLAGIRRRVAALDGVTRIDSPSGRGTMIVVELPCGA